MSRVWLKHIFEKALEECDTVIQIAPDFADAHNLRGVILEALNRKDEAISAYREAVRLDPDFYEARENLQDAKAELNAAIRHFDYLSTSPDDN